jgi:hypothetical protein
MDYVIQSGLMHECFPQLLIHTAASNVVTSPERAVEFHSFAFLETHFKFRNAGVEEFNKKWTSEMTLEEMNQLAASSGLIGFSHPLAPQIPLKRRLIFEVESDDNGPAQQQHQQQPMSPVPPTMDANDDVVNITDDDLELFTPSKLARHHEDVTTPNEAPRGQVLDTDTKRKKKVFIG